MITNQLYYGQKYIHKESGREATVSQTSLFVKLNRFETDWTESVAYSMTDKPNAVFVRSVDSFRAAFDSEKKEGE